ncbi:MAG: type II toxin-antitoxin system MqsA family antitoxin [Chloroflexi bacterium]|nr:type II toxin-antitoxin system MqsA family antitoxin [Chloroflexota bacterium]
MSHQSTSCSVCGGTLLAQRITYTQTIGGQLYIVEDAPALVCQQCGETYLCPETVDAIQEQLEHGRATGTREVPVYRVPEPAR